MYIEYIHASTNQSPGYLYFSHSYTITYTCLGEFAYAYTMVTVYEGRENVAIQVHI